MKKAILMSAIFAMCLSTMGWAQSIVIVTNDNNDQVQYEAFIKGLYPDAVVTMGKFENIDTDAGQYATVENADLVVLARDSTSTDYDDNDGAEYETWNSLETPILCHSAYLSRTDRFKWLNGAQINVDFANMTIVDTADTYFLNGVDISSGTVAMFSSTQTGFDIVGTTSSGNGVTVGTDADGQPVLSYWAPDLVYHDSSPYSSGDWRVWLPGPENSQFIDVLTDDGRKILENAITFLVGGGDPFYNYPPEVTIDGPAFLQVFWAGNPTAVDLSATVTDDGNPVDPGVTTITWSGDGVVFNAPNAAATTATFSAPGVYTITLTADDGEETVVKTKTVRLVDELEPMAYWPMDVIVDANIVPDVIGGNDGVLQGAEPNLVAGYIGDGALQFFGGDEYMLVGINEVAGPNFVTEPVYGASVSAWIKVDAFDTIWQTVISRGDDSWRLARNDREAGSRDAMSFHCSGVSGNGPTPAIGSPGVNDGLWHHVVGSYDGSVVNVYTDGVLSASLESNGEQINMSSNPIVIGGQIQDGVLQRLWKGCIDDVKVYNYGITADQVRAMSSEGMLPPVVQIGDLASPVVYRYNEEIALPGSVDDFGLNGMNDVSVLWTTVSGPSVDTEVSFLDPSNPATTAVFPEFGAYVLRLTAFDNGLGVEVSMEVSITLESPTCQDVIDAGFQQRADFNGDCYVDLLDLAEFAKQWAQCVNPADPDCKWVFE